MYYVIGTLSGEYCIVHVVGTIQLNHSYYKDLSGSWSFGALYLQKNHRFQTEDYDEALGYIALDEL